MTYLNRYESGWVTKQYARKNLVKRTVQQKYLAQVLRDPSVGTLPTQ